MVLLLLLLCPLAVVVCGGKICFLHVGFGAGQVGVDTENDGCICSSFVLLVILVLFLVV